MPHILTAICYNCSYNSNTLIIGDGEHFIGICHHCNSVVNPKIVLFQLTLSPCPNCGKPIDFSERIDVFDTSAHDECPKCKEGVLELESSGTLNVNVSEQFPQVGEIVHGTISDTGELKIRGVILFDGKLFLKNPPSKTDKPMMLKVTKIEKGWFDEADFPPPPKEEQLIIKRISLEFIRYLTQDDLVMR
jgi:hypothetical protein